MRIVVHPADDGGCGHYRLIFPAEILAAQGHQVTLRSEHTYRAVWQPSAFGDRIIDLDEHVDADVIVLQRPLERNRVELIRVLQARGHAVVVEIDDDFHSLHRRNPAWAQTNPLRDRDKNWDWLKRACDLADLVTVSTPALANRYGAHGRVAVLPNLVPAWYCDIPPHEPGRVVIGWSGSVHTHPGDLNVTDGAVADVLRHTPAQFAVIGQPDGVTKALGIGFALAATGWLPIDRYPMALAALDIGIVPLRPGPFNEAKSNLKMSEMAAAGAVPVASPTGPNRELVAAGAGLLADSRQDWYDQLLALTNDEPYRLDLAQRGREVMRLRTYERHAWRWLEAWERAAANVSCRPVTVTA